MGISDRATRGRWPRALTGLCAIGMSTIADAQSLSHAPDPLFHDGYEGVAAGPFTDSDASRLLAQATFGPTDADIAHLRAVGYQGWLNEQFAATPTYEITDQTGQTAYLNWVQNTLGENIGQTNRQEAWFLGALGGHDPQYPTNATHDHQDQLRQRVAFALSEILVISDQNPTLAGQPAAMAHLYDLLVDNAFGNYKTLLEQVTLSPAMGVYLNMMGSRRADLSQNLHPDENYGREINQLFSVGLVMLNLDGTPTTNPPTSTYSQDTIKNFAHVFTSWNWASCDMNYDASTTPPTFTGYSDNFNGCFPYVTPSDLLTPMVAYDTTNPLYPKTSPSYHDDGTDTVNDIASKQLLSYPGAVSGGTLTSGGTAQSDLDFAINNIYNHPNVAPFISKQLIQRLVTSNPSPAYVQRVATEFKSHSADPAQLKFVVQAILLDQEARYGQWQNPDSFGKLREPLIVLTHFWRAMHAVHAGGCNLDQNNGDGTFTHYRYLGQPYRYGGYATGFAAADTTYGVGVGQAAQDADTVFNFFKPTYLPPGEMTTRNLRGPEFQITTDTTITNTTSSAGLRAFALDTADIPQPCTPAQSALSTSTSGGTGLSGSTKYFYVVTGISTQGESGGSNEQSITTGAGTHNSNTVKWTASADATGYRIYRGTAVGAENVFYEVGNVNTFVDTGATATSGNPSATYPDFGDVGINHAQDAALAGSASGGPADPADALVDAYSKRFMSGQMSPFMRQTLLDYLNPINAAQDGSDWKVQRIQRALFLILTSPEYQIQK